MRNPGHPGGPPPDRVGVTRQSYIVQPGDTLEGIAHRHSVSVGELIKANAGNPGLRLLDGNQQYQGDHEGANGEKQPLVLTIP